MHKIVIALILSLVISISSEAQLANTPVKLSLYLSMDEPIQDISSSCNDRLKKKIEQIISTNGAANGTISSGITISPTLVVVEQDVVETGMQNINTVVVDFGMIIEQKSQGAQYASINRSLRGSGKGKEAAIANAIASIKPNDSQYAQFLNTAIRKITNHYEQNCRLYLDKANNFADNGQVDKALELLASIPEVVSCYGQIRDITALMTTQTQEINCREALQVAYSKLALKKWQEALEILSTIKPNSTCADSAMSLQKRIELLKHKQDSVKQIATIPAKPKPIEKKDSTITAPIGKELPAGLVAFYSFDNANADDETGNYHAMAPNGITTITDTPNGKGKAISITTKNKQYINIPYALLEQKKSFSISFWIKDFSDGWVLGGRSKESNDWRYDSDYSRWGSPRVIIIDSKLHATTGWESDVAFSSNISTFMSSEWHQIVITFTANESNKLYVDGRLIAQNSNNQNSSSTAIEFQIGSTSGHNSMKIDNVRFYSRAISVSEINNLYQYESK